jgi:hypothetical protein
LSITVVANANIAIREIIGTVIMNNGVPEKHTELSIYILPDQKIGMISR